MTSAFQSAVLLLMQSLEEISARFQEVTDTDVSDAIHLTLNYYVVWGQDVSRFPSSYHMFTKEGDARVCEAVRRFVLAARESDELQAVPLGQARLALLQDESLRTAGGSTYDLFWGYRESPLPLAPLPDDMFADSSG